MTKEKIEEKEQTEEESERMITVEGYRLDFKTGEDRKETIQKLQNYSGYHLLDLKARVSVLEDAVFGSKVAMRLRHYSHLVKKAKGKDRMMANCGLYAVTDDYD